MYRIVLTIGQQEIPTHVFFKESARAEKWINAQYLVIAALVLLLKNTRDFSIFSRKEVM